VICRTDDLARSPVSVADLVTRTAAALETEAAGALIEMLATVGMRDEPGNWPLPLLNQPGGTDVAGFGPIRLGPALRVHLDPL